MPTLVLKDAEAFFMRGTIDVGWRTFFAGSKDRDRVWGNCKQEVLQELLVDIKQGLGEFVLVDERTAISGGMLPDPDPTDTSGNPA